jgi:hypothetical protein
LPCVASPHLLSDGIPVLVSVTAHQLQ